MTINAIPLQRPTAAIAVEPKSANNDLVNETKRGLKDCFQADRKGNLEDLLLTISAVNRILHAYRDAYDRNSLKPASRPQRRSRTLI